MPKVRVKLYAMLRQYRPDLGIGQPVELDLEDGATIGRVADVLGIPRDTVKTVFVNGRIREQDYPLSDGDQVGMFPPVAGG